MLRGSLSLRHGFAIGLACFFLAVFVLVPILIEATGRSDLYYTLSSVALLSIGSAGVWLTFYIGRINIGQGAYALAGGYVSAILVAKHDVSFWITLPLAGLFCAGLSVLIGLPILRLRGVYFAMVTLVLTEVARLSALALPITNGAKGITSIPSPVDSKLASYFMAAVLMTLCFAGMYRLVNSRIGHICRSLQQNEELASSIGVNVTRLRIIAYAISSFLGGITGASFVVLSKSIYPSTFVVKDSIDFMLNCFLGGLGYVFGPMLGTLVLYFGWDLLFVTGQFQLLIYASVLILLMLTLPNGLLSLRLPSRAEVHRTLRMLAEYPRLLSLRLGGRAEEPGNRIRKGGGDGTGS